MLKNISLIHCADLHFDAPFKSMGSKTCDRRNDIKKTFERVITLLLEKDVDYLLVSGDLYEHDYAGRTVIQWINEQFKRLGEKTVILIPGNHDPYTSNSWYRNYPWSPNVHILSSKTPDYRDEFCYFYGIGFDTYRQEMVSIAKQPEILTEYLNICLYHGTVDMPFAQQAYNPVDSNELLKMGFDYYALGHFHKSSDALAEKGILNPGSPEPLGFDEQGEHGVYFVSLSKDSEKVHREYEFIPFQQRKYCEIEFDVGEITDSTQLNCGLLKAIENKASKADILKIILTGRLTSSICIDLKEMEQSLMAEYYFAVVKDNTKPAYNLEELAVEKNITGVFVTMMHEKMKKAPDGDEKQMLEKALYLGIEALLTGNVEI